MSLKVFRLASMALAAATGELHYGFRRIGMQAEGHRGLTISRMPDGRVVKQFR